MSHRSRPALLLLSFLIALLLFLGFNLGLVQGSILGEITVCDLGCDHVTIRDAIAQAQTGDTIDVASGIYTETLTISRSLALQGAGKGLTVVDGDRVGTVVSITTGVRVTITGMTISNGLALLQGLNAYGGGIFNLGHLSLLGVEILGNNAEAARDEEFFRAGNAFGGGIYNGCGPELCASLIVSDSLVSRNDTQGGYEPNLAAGGGLYNDCSSDDCGRVTLQRSEITNNSTHGGYQFGRSQGGGIYNAGIITVTDTLVQQNVAVPGYEPSSYSPSTGLGGGIQNLGQLTVRGSTINGNWTNREGGGISNSGDGLVHLLNSTISHNWSWHGGGIYSDGDVVLENVTLYQNQARLYVIYPGVGGGIYNNGTVTSHNTITAGNVAYDDDFSVLPAQGHDCYGTISSLGHNLIEDSDHCSVVGVSAGNITGQQAFLNPLADLGGPTPTHGPWLASPVLDAGDPSNCPAVDQRGAPRPADSDGDGHKRCDIGAVEGTVPPPFTLMMPLSVSQ